MTEQELVEAIAESRIVTADPRAHVVCNYMGGHVDEGRMVKVSARLRRVEGACSRCGRVSSRLDIVRP